VYQSGFAVITAIVGSKAGEGDLLAWYSKDGLQWSEPVRVNDVANSAREGLHAMAAGNGWVVAVWLDLRAKGTRVYGSRSKDGGVTWTPNFLVYESPSGTICECCHPSVRVGPAGEIHVIWRNSIDGSRDIYYSRAAGSALEWSPARKVGRETWKLNACPMDGGGIAVASNGGAVTAWRRGDRIYVAKPDGGESELGKGKDPAIAAGLNDSLYAVWTSPEGVRMRSTKEDREQSLSAAGAFPQVLFTGKRVLAFWEEEGGIAMGVVDSLASPATKVFPLEGPRTRNPKAPK
jgi:hypothetical protein